MREITIALAQMAPVLNDNEENLRRMAATIQRICSEQPTNLIVFPELAVSGYECGLNFTRLAERVPGTRYRSWLARPPSSACMWRSACRSKRRSRASSSTRPCSSARTAS